MAVSGAILTTFVPLPLKNARTEPAGQQVQHSDSCMRANTWWLGTGPRSRNSGELCACRQLLR